MCGLAGFWNRNGAAADSSIIEKMLRALIHRGPDDGGSWTDGEICLGVRRLSILDPSDRGHQPFVGSPGVLVYNGEIYNFIELRRELEALGYTFRGTSDTEVVFQALCEWGVERAVPRFNGMFALAYYDLRAKALWLARDRAGIKPLYWAASGSVLTFASEVKALLAHPAIPCRPDMHALTTQGMFGRLAGSWTPFESVSLVTPGTLIKFSAAGEEVLPYFDLLSAVDPGRITGQSRRNLESIADEFESLLLESVRSQLVSDAPLAIMCSGGLDSSLVTAMAAREYPERVAYVADMEGDLAGEADRAEIVCRHTGVDLRRVPYSRGDLFRDWPFCVQYNEHPNFFSCNLPARAIAHAAHRDGFKVLLGGDGADELFGGYKWQAKMYRRGQQMARNQAIMRWVPGLSRLSHNLARFSRAGDLDRLIARASGSRFFLMQGDFSGAGAWALDGMQRAVRCREFFDKLSPLNRLQDRAFLAQSFEDFHSHLGTSLLSSDKMMMSHSIELRVPFLDNRLIDFGLNAPMHAKFSRGINKRLARYAARNWLPPEIAGGTKVGFGVPVNLWKGSEQLLRGGAVADLFKWPQGSEEKVREMISSNPATVFQMVSLELWIRIFCRNESPEQCANELMKCKG